MKSEKKDQNFFDEVIKGIKRASVKMAEKSASNNEELIIGDDRGNAISVPAKDLLKTLKP